MNKYSLMLATALVAGSAAAHAATIEVGAGKRYTTLAAAAAATRDGDTVIVYPGTYTSGAVWRANHITIRQPTGTAYGKAVISGGAVSGKGLFVTTGANITIDGLKFQNAKVSSGNGAGIRAEGTNLTVKNSTFYNNEMGILATPVAALGGKLTVENSKFDLTQRAAGGTAHSLYVGNSNLQELVVAGSTFTRNKVGHYIKSRARKTTVTGSTIDDTGGTGSYLIDVPEGGAVTITNNRLIKGAYASNCCTAIALGFEMYKGASYQNPAGTITIDGNSFTNKRTQSKVTFVANRTGTAAALTNNTLSGGTIVPLRGAGSNNGVVS